MPNNPPRSGLSQGWQLYFPCYWALFYWYTRYNIINIEGIICQKKKNFPQYLQLMATFFYQKTFIIYVLIVIFKLYGTKKIIHYFSRCWNYCWAITALCTVWRNPVTLSSATRHWEGTICKHSFTQSSSKTTGYRIGRLFSYSLKHVSHTDNSLEPLFVWE